MTSGLRGGTSRRRKLRLLTAGFPASHGKHAQSSWNLSTTPGEYTSSLIWCAVLFFTSPLPPGSPVIANGRRRMPWDNPAAVSPQGRAFARGRGVCRREISQAPRPVALRSGREDLRCLALRGPALPPLRGPAPQSAANAGNPRIAQYPALRRVKVGPRGTCGAPHLRPARRALAASRQQFRAGHLLSTLRRGTTARQGEAVPPLRRVERDRCGAARVRWRGRERRVRGGIPAPAGVVPERGRSDDPYPSETRACSRS